MTYKKRNKRISEGLLRGIISQKISVRVDDLAGQTQYIYYSVITSFDLWIQKMS